MAVVVAVKSVLTLQHRTFVQLPSKIQGAMHPASTSSFEFAAIWGLCRENSSRSCVKSSTFRREKNNETYVRVIRYHETCGCHVCAGRVNHVVDLDLTVARAGPHDAGAGRAANAPSGPEVGKHPPEEITIRANSCGETLPSTR